MLPTWSWSYEQQAIMETNRMPTFPLPWLNVPSGMVLRLVKDAHVVLSMWALWYEVLIIAPVGAVYGHGPYSDSLSLLPDQRRAPVGQAVSIWRRWCLLFESAPTTVWRSAYGNNSSDLFDLFETAYCFVFASWLVFLTVAFPRQEALKCKEPNESMMRISKTLNINSLYYFIDLHSPY